MTAIARKGLRTKIRRSRAERKGPLLLGKSARQNGPVLPAVKISQLPLARTTCFGRRISVPSEAWEAYREACLKYGQKFFRNGLVNPLSCLQSSDGKSSGETIRLQLYRPAQHHGESCLRNKQTSLPHRRRRQFHLRRRSFYRYNHLRPVPIRKFGRTPPHRI